MAELPQPVSPTIAAIEAAVEAAAVRDFDAVVRASSIGRPCERDLWYRFRWARPPEAFSGRMLRLFDTGHVEEVRMVAWLGMAGVDVAHVDPATWAQWEVTALDGHFKGHADGICTGVVEAPAARHLLECKTHNAKSFAQLLKHGVAVSKPEHVAQMQVYMHLLGLDRALYLAKNKDDDTLHIERVKYDPATATALMAKAERIVRAGHAPPQISADPDSWACRGCASAEVCHHGAFGLINCRTCLHASPASAGGWHCARFDRRLSVEDQRAACPAHLFVPDLVPGEQVDVNEAAETVTYRMRDGSAWVDGRAKSP